MVSPKANVSRIGDELMTTPNLAVDLGGLKLNNPVMTASGTFGYAGEFQPYIDLNRLGGIIVKGLSLSHPKEILLQELWKPNAACSMPSDLKMWRVDMFLSRKIAVS
jgi:hypothetical protein